MDMSVHRQDDDVDEHKYTNQSTHHQNKPTPTSPRATTHKPTKTPHPHALQVIPDLLEDCQRKCREDSKYLMSNLTKDQELVRAGMVGVCVFRTCGRVILQVH